MRLIDAASQSFARHETFHPRYGWFRKAYVFASRSSRVFSREDAPVIIGVGKNMVRAIRFWGLAAKLIVEDEASEARVSAVVPTRFGHALFGEDGWDPYMEDPGTLWLLHWMLLAPRSRLPVWWLAFQEFHPIEFSQDDLRTAVLAQLDSAAGWKTPHLSSIDKDLSALLRTYAPFEGSGRAGIDDALDCPLRELQLIRRSPATGRFRFALGPKATLPAQVLAYILLDYVARLGVEGSTINMSRFAHDVGGPGRALKMTESEILDILRPAIADLDGLALTNPTGATQLSWRGDPGKVAVRILSSYYDATPADIVAGPIGDLPVSDEILEYLGAARDATDAMHTLELIGTK